MLCENITKVIQKNVMHLLSSILFLCTFLWIILAKWNSFEIFIRTYLLQKMSQTWLEK